MQVPGVLDVLFLTSALLSAPPPDLAPFCWAPGDSKSYSGGSC